jgi:ubiquinone/menaquinone biosynthesis C-methylase UbiE
MPTTTKKPYRGLPMEGWTARWYARLTANDLAAFRELAAALAAPLPPGGGVLEVAPGPGYLAIEIARLGDFRVTGVDISTTFVQLAADNARQTGVAVDFQHGNAAALPCAAESFDLVVCRAAFKNFAEPVEALREMHRVLKPGGRAVVLDMRSDAAPRDLDAHVNTMKLGWFNRLITKWIFKHSLVKNAYTEEQFRQMAAATPFQRCDIKLDPIGLEVTLTKSA